MMAFTLTSMDRYLWTAHPTPIATCDFFYASDYEIAFTLNLDEGTPGLNLVLTSLTGLQVAAINLAITWEGGEITNVEETTDSPQLYMYTGDFGGTSLGVGFTPTYCYDDNFFNTANLYGKAAVSFANAIVTQYCNTFPGTYQLVDTISSTSSRN